MFLPHASPSSRQSTVTNTTTTTTTTTSQPTCGFSGNNDIYGPGIRIGIYSQILAVWFANYFLLSEALILRDAVTIFSVAILIVACIYSAHPSDVYAVEAFVLLMILAWACMMGVRAKSSYSSGVFSKGSLARRVVCEALGLANLGLQVWFWWVGVGRMKRTPCGTWLMMYVVKTDLLGWARKVMMALSLFVLVVTVYWVVVEGLRVWGAWEARVARREFGRAVGMWVDLEKERLEVGENQDSEQLEDDASVVSEERISHDGCSKFSCVHCSPTRSEFDLGWLVGIYLRP
ncbi:hypothetical protein NX059_011414 [Plenodomus lindquistii]|nr:hypothetical protein NX059_011414 [Plenodomus lindquistii]